MDKVLFLGNGFDLHHKLATGYDCFLNTMEFLIDRFNGNYSTIGDVFGSDQLQNRNRTIAESYKLYKDVYDSTPLNIREVDKMIELAKHNCWLSYLFSSFNQQIGWIDFEKEIGKAVDAFQYFFEMRCDTTYSEDDSGYEFELNYTDDKDYYIVSQFGFFFEDANESGYYPETKYAKKEYIIEDPYGSKIYRIDRDKIILHLYNSLRELASILKTYLKLFVDSILDEVNERKLFHKNDLFSNARCVLTLNYTTTCERLYGVGGYICHIHGDLNGNIVLGLNADSYDELEDLDTSFISFKKYFQRVMYRTDYSYQRKMRELVAAKQQNDSLRVFVVGHSLDITDQEIIKNVFDVANKIVILYHKVSAVQNYIRNLVRIYGKSAFDKLRAEKELEFLPLEKEKENNESTSN